MLDTAPIAVDDEGTWPPPLIEQLEANFARLPHAQADIVVAIDELTKAGRSSATIAPGSPQRQLTVAVDPGIDNVRNAELSIVLT